MTKPRPSTARRSLWLGALVCMALALPHPVAADEPPAPKTSNSFKARQLRRYKRTNCPKLIAKAARTGSVDVSVMLAVDARFEDRIAHLNDPEQWAHEEQLGAALLAEIDRALPAESIAKRRKGSKGFASFDFTIDRAGARWLCSSQRVAWIGERLRIYLD